MMFALIILTTVAVKLLVSFFIYGKTKHVFSSMSLPVKGVVIGSGWLFTFGLFHLLEEFI